MIFLSGPNWKAPSKSWIDDCVWRQEIKRAETNGIDFFDSDEIQKMGREDANPDGLFSIRLQLFRTTAEGRHRAGSVRRTPSDLHRTIVAAATQQIGAEAEPNTVARRLVERTILRGYATLLDQLRDIIREIPAGPAAEKTLRPAAFIFTAHWANFEQHKRDNREWKADSASEDGPVCRTLT